MASSPPPASGPVYKCAICGDLVYESQLDYHVEICPEPDGNTPRKSTTANVAAPSSAPQPTPKLGDQADESPQLVLGPAPPRSTMGYAELLGDNASEAPAERDVGNEADMVQHPVSRSSSAPPPGSQLSGAAELGEVASGNTSPSASDKQPPRTRALPGTLRGNQITLTELASNKEDGAKTSSSEVLPRSKSLPPYGGSSGSNRPVWRRWKDSEVQKHHVEAAERSRERRRQLQNQLQQKEADACTFTPHLMPRRCKSYGPGSSRTRSPVNSSRGLAGNLSENSLHCQQGSTPKQTKIDRVRAELYADITFRPQISPGARAWSAQEKLAREATADREGRSPPTVFERLYQIAVQERQARQDAEAALAVPVLAPSRSEGATEDRGLRSASGSARRLQTVNLLYDDAQERQRRLRCMEEQVVEHRENERRAACQVLARSRRYYWQMLERQIKASFDAAFASNGVEEDCLTYPMLEEFLRHFGCLRPPRSSALVAIERAAEESRRLRIALWRHLDPYKRGYVDFLTLTVFFHVLMGAVDEEAQCLHNLSSEPQLQSSSFDEDSLAACGQQLPGLTNGSPSKGLGTEPALSLGSRSPEGSSAVALGAIFEEEDVSRSTAVEQEGVQQRGLGGASVVSQAAEAAASADPEGRRICELLMRFDPKQLRSEFRQLYLDRLHHMSAVGMAAAEEARPKAPEMNEQSRHLAERLVQKQRGDAGGNLASHADLLYWRHEQTKAKIEEKRELRKDEEVQECTFHPTVKTPRRATSAGATHRSQGGRFDRLYANAVRRQEKLEARAEMCEQRRFEEELEACTFRPDTSRSGRSYMRHGTVVASPKNLHPRGYDQCKQRLRRAFAGQVQKRRLLENRFVSIDSASLGYAVEEKRFPSAIADGLNIGRAEPSMPSTPTERPAPAKGNAHSPRSPTAAVSIPAAADAGRYPQKAAPPSPVGARTSGGGMRIPPKPLQGMGRENGSAARGGDSNHGHARSSDTAAAGEKAMPPPTTTQPGPPTTTQLGHPSTAVDHDGNAVPPPLVYVEVNIAPGKPPERLVLREGQTPAEAAAEFAVKHHLSPQLAQRLHELLKELLMNPELPGRTGGTSGRPPARPPI